MTKCTFHKYGPGGSVETKDGLCILPLNIINEKIYVFIWFWFIFLALVTAIHVNMIELLQKKTPGEKSIQMLISD